MRQQWNFSPPKSARETEYYAVELSGVTMIELMIVPDRSGGGKASLSKFSLAQLPQLRE